MPLYTPNAIIMAATVVSCYTRQYKMVSYLHVQVHNLNKYNVDIFIASHDQCKKSKVEL